MNEPTQERIKEFWERCDLYKDGGFWYTSIGQMLSEETPTVDLNNLFEYAVPEDCEIHFYKDKSAQDINCIITLPNEREFDGSGNTYEDALFWALDKVRGKDK